MDVFYEQLYKKKKGITGLIAQVCMIAVAFILAVAVFLFLSRFALGQMIGFLAVAGIAYGAYRLNMFFDIEYEYIYLNGEIDFDKIIAKNSRTREISVKAVNVDQYGVYDEQAKSKLAHADIKNKNQNNINFKRNPAVYQITADIHNIENRKMCR